VRRQASIVFKAHINRRQLEITETEGGLSRIAGARRRRRRGRVRIRGATPRDTRFHIQCSLAQCATRWWLCSMRTYRVPRIRRHARDSRGYCAIRKRFAVIHALCSCRFSWSWWISLRFIERHNNLPNLYRFRVGSVLHKTTPIALYFMYDQTQFIFVVTQSMTSLSHDIPKWWFKGRSR